MACDYGAFGHALSVTEGESLALSCSISPGWRFYARRSAQALRVRDSREREILRKHVELLDHAIEQVEFLMQSGMTLRRQCVRRFIIIARNRRAIWMFSAP